MGASSEEGEDGEDGGQCHFDPAVVEESGSQQVHPLLCDYHWQTPSQHMQ